MHAPGNWQFDYAYISNTAGSDHECAALCSQFVTCIGFANYDINVECRCYFSEAYRVQPDAGLINGFVERTGGDYPITHSTGIGGMTCYKFDEVEWGSNAPTFTPTNAPVPFTGIYTYVGEGTCRHAPGNWNLDFVYLQGMGITSDYECAQACYLFETCIGFANYDNNAECRCFSTTVLEHYHPPLNTLVLLM